MLYRFVCVLVIAAVIAITVSGIVIGRSLSDDPQKISQPPQDVEELPKYYSGFGAMTEVSKENSQIDYGDLILVNYQYPCVYEEPQLTAMLENSAYNYTVADYDVKINTSVFDYADKLLGDFETQNGGSSDILVACAYRSRQLQTELYNDKLEADGKEEADKWIAKPGYSEHQSGYSMDLSVMIDGVTYDYDGAGDEKWINDNCYKYGFIVRYPEDRSETTKIEHEPWHFRYVGVPHAEYIFKNNLCFEDYIELLHGKTAEQPLVIDSESGKYAVYYCAKDALSQSTAVPVPSSLEYTVSGDNIGGFIVTVKL